MQQIETNTETLQIVVRFECQNIYYNLHKIQQQRQKQLLERQLHSIIEAKQQTLQQQQIQITQQGAKPKWWKYSCFECCGLSVYLFFEELPPHMTKLRIAWCVGVKQYDLSKFTFLTNVEFIQNGTTTYPLVLYSRLL